LVLSSTSPAETERRKYVKPTECDKQLPAAQLIDTAMYKRTGQGIKNAIFWDVTVCQKFTDVSQERATSIFRVEE
jgi:hypothetical protein